MTLRASKAFITLLVSSKGSLAYEYFVKDAIFRFSRHGRFPAPLRRRKKRTHYILHDEGLKFPAKLQNINTAATF